MLHINYILHTYSEITLHISPSNNTIKCTSKLFDKNCISTGEHYVLNVFKFLNQLRNANYLS